MFRFNKTLAMLALGFAVASLSACTQIDTGNVGVERSFGKINATPQPQGLYATVFDSVDEFTTKEVSFPLADMSPKSRDNLTLKDLDIDVYYRVEPARIPALYVKYQGDYARHGDVIEKSTTPDVLVIGINRVMRAAREATYISAASFDATTMHTQRTEMAESIRKNLQAELDKSDRGSFLITSINVRNLLTDPAIEASIRARAQTDQDIARKHKEVELAKAEADRLRAQAQGEADANRILSESLTGSVLQLRMAELQKAMIVESAGKGSTIINGEATALVGQK